MRARLRPSRRAAALALALAATAGASACVAGLDLWPDASFPDDPQGEGFCHRASAAAPPSDRAMRACFVLARPAFERLRAAMVTRPRVEELDAATAPPGPIRDDLRAIGAFRVVGGGPDRALELSVYRFGIVTSGMIKAYVFSPRPLAPLSRDTEEALPAHADRHAAIEAGWYLELEAN